MLQPRLHGRGMSPGALAWRMRADAVLLSGARLRLLLLAKANFDPAQPRLPAGQAEGGQWTKVPGWAGSTGTRPERPTPGTALAQARPRGRGGGGTYLIGGRLIEVTPGQALRIDLSAMRADAAIARVQRLDPRWNPPPQVTSTIEGEIAANEARLQQAEARLAELHRAGIGTPLGDANSIPARGPSRRFTTDERDAINKLGARFGCHTCGSFDPGTSLGNFVPDHQLPNALNRLGAPQRLYPQCLTCSFRQGSWITNNRGGRQ